MSALSAGLLEHGSFDNYFSLLCVVDTLLETGAIARFVFPHDLFAKRPREGFKILGFNSSRK